MEGSNKIGNATKWSVLTEIAAKLITPISNMILARLLTPEAFGVVATATMIFSFADMFTDSGFQKYLIQHEFENEKDREESTNVAFWTNMGLSIVLWFFIAVFSDQIAALVGNPGLGTVITISCASLPLTSFSSIQMALYRRDFDFKTLFYVRIVAVLIPLFVTIPLAFLTHSYWALVVGTLCGNLSNAVILTIRSSWKPKRFYSVKKLKEMLSFSIWSLVEAVLIWLTNYVGVFIVGSFLNSYYLGLYKTSMNTVNQIMNLVTSATSAVLFSALSRAQTDKKMFERTFFTFQRNVGLLIVPMGIGIFVFQDFVTSFLLGNQWEEAAGFIGLWGLVNAFKILLSNYCAEAYRAQGRPKVSVFVQISQLVVLVPSIIFGAQKGFTALYIMRSLTALELIAVNLITIWHVIGISPFKMTKNIMPEVFAALVMGGIGFLLRDVNSSVLWSLFSIVICIFVYFAIIVINPMTRKQFTPIMVKTYKNAVNRIHKK